MPYFVVSCVGPSRYIKKRIDNLILSSIVHLRCHDPKAVSEGSLTDQPWKITRIARESSIEALFLDYNQIWCMFIHIESPIFHDSSVKAYSAPPCGIRLLECPKAFSAGLPPGDARSNSRWGPGRRICASSRHRDVIYTLPSSFLMASNYCKETVLRTLEVLDLIVTECLIIKRHRLRMCHLIS